MPSVRNGSERDVGPLLVQLADVIQTVAPHTSMCADATVLSGDFAESCLRADNFSAVI